MSNLRVVRESLAGQGSSRKPLPGVVGQKHILWVMFQDRNKDDTLWIGQGFKLNQPWKDGSGKVAGPCIYKRIEDRSLKINGTEYTRGDYALAINWWKKSLGDPEERTYEAEVPSAEDIEACGMEQDDDVFFLAVEV